MTTVKTLISATLLACIAAAQEQDPEVQVLYDNELEFQDDVPEGEEGEELDDDLSQEEQAAAGAYASRRSRLMDTVREAIYTCLLFVLIGGIFVAIYYVYNRRRL